MVEAEQHQQAEALHLVGAYEADINPDTLAERTGETSESLEKRKKQVASELKTASDIDAGLKEGEKPKAIHEVLAQGDFASYDRQERLDRSLDVFGTDIDISGKKVRVGEEINRHEEAQTYEHAVDNLLQHGMEWFDDLNAKDKLERKKQKDFLIGGVVSALKKVPGLENLDENEQKTIAKHLLSENGMKQEYAKLLDGTLDADRLTGIFSRNEIDQAEEEQKRIAAEVAKIKLAQNDKQRHIEANGMLTTNSTKKKTDLSKDITSLQRLLDTTLDSSVTIAANNRGSLYKQLADARRQLEYAHKAVRGLKATEPDKEGKKIENENYKAKSEEAHESEKVVNQLREQIENTERQLREKRTEVDRINEEVNRLTSEGKTLQLEFDQGTIDKEMLDKLLTSKAALVESAKLSYHSKETSFVNELQSMAEKGATQYLIEQDKAASEGRKEHFKKEAEKTQNETIKNSLEHMDELWFDQEKAFWRSGVRSLREGVPFRKLKRLAIGAASLGKDMRYKGVAEPSLSREAKKDIFQPGRFNADMQVLLRGTDEDVDKLLERVITQGSHGADAAELLKNPEIKSTLTTRLVESMLQTQKEHNIRAIGLDDQEQEIMGKKYGISILEQAVKSERIDKGKLADYLQDESIEKMSSDQIKQELLKRSGSVLGMLLAIFMQGLITSQKELIRESLKA